MLYIDGNPIVDNNNFQGATQATGLAYLTPGLHSIDIEYYQGGGGASLDAQWDPTGGNNFVDIPNSAFFDSVNGVLKTGVGKLTLASMNTYSGSTTINAGTLVVTADGAMGPATAKGIVVNTGGALAFSGGLDYNVAEPATISGNGLDDHGAIENIVGNNNIFLPLTIKGTASIDTTAGSLIISGNISVGASSFTVVGAGSTTINGNISCQNGSVTLAGDGAIKVTGNIDLGPAGIFGDSSSGQDLVNGMITGSPTSGSVMKTGIGVLTLSNIDSYFGPTVVEAGELLVNGQLRNSIISVETGATLGGNGLCSSINVESGGFFSPGDSFETLSTRSLSLAVGATYVEQIGGTSAGNQYDQTVIRSGGSVALDFSTLKITLTSGFSPTVGEQFTIIDNLGNTSVTGRFSQGSTCTFDGYIFGINYAGGTGNDVVLTVLAKRGARPSTSHPVDIVQSSLLSNQFTNYKASGIAYTTNLGSLGDTILGDDLSILSVTAGESKSSTLNSVSQLFEAGSTKSNNWPTRVVSFIREPKQSSTTNEWHLLNRRNRAQSDSKMHGPLSLIDSVKWRAVGNRLRRFD